MARSGRRGANPETILTKQVREVLNLLGVPHHKNWGGPMGERGVCDLIGVLPPAGRALFIELKKPGYAGVPTEEQTAFLQRRKDAGAVAFWTSSVTGVLNALRAAGYEPALRMRINGEPEARA